MHLFLTSLAISWEPPVKSPGTIHWDKGHQVVELRCGGQGGRGFPNQQGEPGGGVDWRGGPERRVESRWDHPVNAAHWQGAAGQTSRNGNRCASGVQAPERGVGGGTQRDPAKTPREANQSVSRCPETDNALVKKQIFFSFLYRNIFTPLSVSNHFQRHYFGGRRRETLGGMIKAFMELFVWIQRRLKHKANMGTGSFQPYSPAQHLRCPSLDQGLQPLARRARPMALLVPRLPKQGQTGERMTSPQQTGSPT